MDLDHDACYRAIELRDARFDGRFFTAVRTTGTYCRPVCPARTPRSENVTFYPTAAAAQEAGFHPCLRCRPETAPDTGAWRGTSNTVSRALALIELGALDEGSVDALAGRLGVGERQLRRLCRQHLGASPVAVAQTRRVLLAKQLIHETSLPMTEIAFAAGFGSIRRFNETFLALFGRAPRALRRGGGPEISASPGGEISLLPALSASLRLAWHAGVSAAPRHSRHRACRRAAATPEPSSWKACRGSFPFALPRTTRCVRRSVSPSCRRYPSSSRACAAYSTWQPIRSPSPPISQRIQHWRRWWRARPGLRVPGAWDGFELAIRAVLGQQITVPAAVRLAGRLVAAHGEPLAEPDRDLTHVFPRPDGIGARGLDDPRHAEEPGGHPFRRRGCCRGRSGSLLRQPRARRGNPAAAIHPRGRRMDGAVHRLAPAARARRISSRRCRSHAWAR